MKIIKRLIAIGCAALMLAANSFGLESVFAGSETSAFAEEFANPTGSDTKLKARYWLPAGYPASSPELLEEIDREMKEMADAGYSGVEISNVFQRMSASEQEVLKQGDGESSYLYGSKYYTETVKQVLKSAKAYGMTVDITSGTHWPSASDQVDLEDDAVVKELVYSTTELNKDETFTDLQENIIKKTNESVDSKNELVGVYAVQYAGKNIKSKTSGYGDSQTTTEWDQYEILSDTMVKLDAVSGDSYNFTAPDDNYVIIEIYQRSTGSTISYASYNNPDTDYTGYLLCSFSEAGTEEWIRYFEEEVFDDEIRELLKEVRGNFFEDNFAFNAETTWGTGYLDTFQNLNGYDLSSYLPYVIGMSHSGHSNRSNSTNIGMHSDDLIFVSVDDDDYQQNSVLGDYVQTLSDMYNTNHIDSIIDWAEQYDMGFRVQTYGALIDSAYTASNVTVAEGEEIGFANGYDNNRLLAAGRDMSEDGYVLSSEFGPSVAHNGQPYAYTFDAMLENIYKNYAAGVNSLVLHGYSYMYYPETVWPGAHAFGTTFSGTWSSRDPQWTHVTDWSTHISRMQYALQQGEQKTDVAIYSSDANSQIAAPYYEDTGLTEAGYSYQFFTKGLFTLDSAVVSNSKLNESGAGYKAIVFNNETALSMAVINKLSEFADAGFPVVFIGDTPVISTTNNDSASDVQNAIKALLEKDSVVKISDESELVATLEGFGVYPDLQKSASNQTNESLINIQRELDGGDIYYLYNDSDEEQTYTVTLNSAGSPFVLDAWSGDITPVAGYQTDGKSVTLSVTLSANDAMLLGVSNTDIFGESPEVYAVDSTHNTAYNNGNLVAIINEDSSYSVATNDGKTYSGTVSNIQSAIEIDEWDLSVISWTDGGTTFPITTAKTEIYLDHTEAKSWTDIDGIGGTVSGVGVYKASFNINDADSLGAVLTFTEISDTFRVTVNGVALPASNIVSDSVNLDGYLVTGENTLVIEVATSLQNAYNATLGTDPYQEYGIIGTTTITPYYNEIIVELNADTSSSSSEISSSEDNSIIDTSSSSEDTSTPDTSTTDTFLSDNTVSSSGKQGVSPKTGDQNSVWFILSVMLVMGTTIVVLKKRRKG